MKREAAQRRRRKSSDNDLNVFRRSEIIRHALEVGAADSDDLGRWLIAWSWHNRQSKDQVGALIFAAARMGRYGLTAEDAEALLEEASYRQTPPTADSLARYLGLTYRVRQRLKIRTIGAKDVSKRVREGMRKHRDLMAKERKRREQGARSHSESLSQTRPWEAFNISRATWYRRRTNSELRRETNSSAILFSSSSHTESVSRAKREFERGFAPKEARGSPSSQTATTIAADRHASLPMELRFLALGLPMPENLARAA